MKSIVISLGGSLIIPARLDIGYLRSFKQMVNHLVKKKFRVVVVCGGGRLAADYISAAKDLGKVSDHDLDLLGIYATKINAQLIKSLFGSSAYEKVVEDPSKRIASKKRIIVGSGWKPGFSSDQDAVILAKQLKADTILNLSNIPYVYDKDPRKHKHFKALPKVSWPSYLKLIPKTWTPRLNTPFDPVASRTAQKAKLKVVVMDGKDLKNVKDYLDGKDFRGTVIG